MHYEPHCTTRRPWLPRLLALAQLLYLALCVRAYAVDVPVDDQWALVPLLDKSYRGALTLRDLWSQHNEHRLLFPRILIIALARLSGWNIGWELAANIALSAGTLAVLWYQARKSAAALGAEVGWLLPVLALAVFSLNQAENWLAGWNVQIFLCVFAVTATIVLLAHVGGNPFPVLTTDDGKPTTAQSSIVGRLSSTDFGKSVLGRAAYWGAFVLAILAAILASYSTIGGLLIWPVGALMLAFERRRARLALWLLAGALTGASYFYGYQGTSQQPPLPVVLANLPRYVVYALTYIGTPVSRGAVELLFELISGDTKAVCDLGESDLCAYVNAAALVSGIAGVGLAIWIGAVVARRRAPFRPLAPLWALIAYALASAALTSLGRASYGNHQALSQRYVTVALLFWLALVIVLWLCAQRPDFGRRRALLARAVVVVFVVAVALGSLQGRVHFARQYEQLAPARPELTRLTDDNLIRRLFPDPAYVRKQVRTLQKYHLSVFRDP